MRLRYGMTIFVVTSFLLIMSLTVVAQQNTDLEVSDIQWTEDANRRLRPHTPYKMGASLSETDHHSLQEISALFHNKGTKTIKSVKWDICLI